MKKWCFALCWQTKTNIFALFQVEISGGGHFKFDEFRVSSSREARAQTCSSRMIRRTGRRVRVGDQFACYLGNTSSLFSNPPHFSSSSAAAARWRQKPLLFFSPRSLLMFAVYISLPDGAKHYFTCCCLSPIERQVDETNSSGMNGNQRPPPVSSQSMLKLLLCVSLSFTSGRSA